MSSAHHCHAARIVIEDSVAEFSAPQAAPLESPSALRKREAAPVAHHSLLPWVALVAIVGIVAIFWLQSFQQAAPEAGTTTASPAVSIAVLPFVDFSPDGDHEYFGDGIAEELINKLVKVPQMRVAGRTSSFSFKGQDLDLPHIGEFLNVDTILEGSVRTSGDSLRIRAQLINAEDCFQLWSF